MMISLHRGFPEGELAGSPSLQPKGAEGDLR
jgi:hypothetical protein